jgi:hypothetical protein
MPTDKTSTSYIAGKQAWAAGLDLADRPAELLMDWTAWEQGWLDAMAVEVRSLKGK